MTQWISKLGGTKAIIGWLNKLLDCCKASELKYVIGGKLIEGPDGKSLIIPPAPTGAGGLETYRVKSKIADVLICRTWDGTTEGSVDVPVAVNFDSRQLEEEIIAGTTYTYSAYSAIDDFNDERNSNDSSTDETQIVTPLWYLNCLIAVAQIDYSGVLFDNTVDDPFDLKLIEVSSRCWAQEAEA